MKEKSFYILQKDFFKKYNNNLSQKIKINSLLE